MTDDPAPVRHVRAAREELLSTTLELVGIDTQNPPGETRAIVDEIESFADDLGVAHERFDIDPAKPNLILRLPGERDDVLLYNGHLDTVPFDEAAWQHAPLGERDGDRLYGRGTTDMKGAVAAMLETLRAYVETDTTPPVSLQLALVSDEETGGPAGLAALLSEDALEAAGCVIGETTCERGRHSLTVADKGSIWLTLEAHGEAAHGSRPMLGDNAIDRCYEAVAEIRRRFGNRRLPIDDEVTPIIEESIAYYEPVLPEKEARRLFERPTINLGTFTGGAAINTVPERATAELDVRLTAGVETSEMLSAIRDCVAGCDGVTVRDVSWSTGTYEPLDSPLVEAVAAAAEPVVGERLYRRSATGGGDAKKLRDAGIPTVEFGLGTDTVHAVDEYTTLGALVGNATVYARLPFAFAERLDAS